MFVVMILLMSTIVYAQDEVWMHPNLGQWDDRIEFKIELLNGDFFIEKDGFTFALSDVKEKMMHSHGHEGHEGHDHGAEGYRYHTIKSKFQNSAWAGNYFVLDSSSFYRNYFLGSDPSKWQSRLHSYSLMEMQDVYDGISILLDGKNGGFKYSYIVQPGSDVSQIQLTYEGADAIVLNKKGELELHHRFGKIIESKPIAWTEKEGTTKPVKVEYKVTGSTVTFNFPMGYDENAKLIIDPSLTFSTFTGATSDNWGMCATPDEAGNLFGGSISFGTGYPVTTGAYDNSFNSGGIDLGITKFNVDGTNLIYSTYLGGNGAEKGTPGPPYRSAPPSNDGNHRAIRTYRGRFDPDGL